jgi:hypothetical protein
MKIWNIIIIIIIIVLILIGCFYRLHVQWKNDV